MKRKAFTLAEIMIVLTVIGILSAILLPVAINSTPDRNVLKFKQTHNLLMSAFRELASNGEWFMPGNFSLKPDGTRADGWASDGERQKYYIHALGDVLNHTGEFVYCDLDTVWSGAPEILDDINAYSISKLNTNYRDAMAELIFEISNSVSEYDSYFKLPNGACIAHRWPGGEYDDAEDYLGFMIDLDCEKRNIRPFGYWLRRDGKVISDIRANWWLKRDITNKETNCCPKELEWLYSCFAGEETAEGCTDQRAISAVCEDDNVPVCAE